MVTYLRTWCFGIYIYIHTHYLFNKSFLLEVEFLAFCMTMYRVSVLIIAIYIPKITFFVLGLIIFIS